jgi:hypothetical protein
MLIKITWQGLKKFRVMRAFLTQKILRGFTIRIGLPQKWAMKIAIWMWLRRKNIST